MIYPLSCLKRFGFPYDIPGSPENEQLTFEKNHMVLFDVPKELEIGVIPKKVYCNKILVEPLTKAFKNLIDRGVVDELKTWDGCFNPRPTRGLENQFKYYISAKNITEATKCLSLHSWGLAIDVNAAWNKLGKTPTLSKEFVNCFKDAGFDWGGDWRRLDGMHFQLREFGL